METTLLTLSTGANMPIIGLGTWRADRGKVGEAVTYALTECGYRHIDCAWIYGNEKEIGEAFKKVFGGNTVKRDEVFVTSKLWNSFHAKKRVAKACKETLNNLKLEYLDLYLVHWGLATPPEDTDDNKDVVDKNGVLITERIPIRETWEAMEELVKLGLVKAIGISNFTTMMILDLLSYATVPPAVNQIELHPYLQQTRFVEFCQHKRIVVTAYSPLGRPGTGGKLINDPVIGDIATKHEKTPAQILLRWGIQRDTIVIPKSITRKRIQENFDVLDFELSRTEMQAIAGLDRKERLVDPYTWGKVPYFD
jgi:diketogulonate reductase-like aldo/keto reductase